MFTEYKYYRDIHNKRDDPTRNLQEITNINKSLCPLCLCGKKMI